MKSQLKISRARANINRLFGRRDARAARRRNYWLQRYGHLCERADTALYRQRIRAGLPRLVTVDLGGGVLVRDTEENLRANGHLDY